MKLDKIVFPVDFSRRCESIAPAVAAIARHFHAEVMLVHAADFPLPAIGVGDGFPETIDLEPLRIQAVQQLDGFGADVFSGLVVRRTVKLSRPVDAILEEAPTREGLIMLPTHGHTRFRQLLLGSVTAGVLHDAQCPVWTSAHAEDGGKVPTDYRSVLCAVDLSEKSAGVLRFADEFGRKFGARIRVVHCVQGIDPRFPSGAAENFHRFLVDRAREDCPKLVRDAGLSIECEILEGYPLAEAVAEAARRQDADVTIIGRGVAKGLLGRLRTTANDLIRRSPCPVISV